MGLLRYTFVLLLVKVFFVGVWESFIGGFSVFLDVHTTLVVEFYGVIYAMEEAQRIGFTRVWL